MWDRERQRGVEAIAETLGVDADAAGRALDAALAEMHNYRAYITLDYRTPGEALREVNHHLDLLQVIWCSQPGYRDLCASFAEIQRKIGYVRLKIERDDLMKQRGA